MLFATRSNYGKAIAGGLPGAAPAVRRQRSALLAGVNAPRYFKSTGWCVAATERYLQALCYFIKLIKISQKVKKVAYSRDKYKLIQLSQWASPVVTSHIYLYFT